MKPSPASTVRAWLFLTWITLIRRSRSSQMVWIALGLLALSVAIVMINTAAGRWTMEHWHFFGRQGPELKTWLDTSQMKVDLATGGGAARSHVDATWGAVRAVMVRSDFLVFTRGFILLLFVSFLLPIWTLSFSTEAMGSEIENQSLVWLMTRPLPRWSIYLSRYLALIPWSVGFTLAGFWLICITAGRPGPIAFRLFWPAVFWSGLAFSSLFMFMGAFLKRPAMIALVYSFFLEVIAGNMPGSFKRISFGFYARCIMFEKAETLGLQPTDPVIYEPVSARTAWIVLLSTSMALLALGMGLFQRKELGGAD